ncbi:hypothetical protein NIASO_19600 [Niabella soli DSM 19437]|uniref:Cell division protein FtsQ n=2 Tax=Niabella TaxID=379899 RepID=W0F4X2_9BACT|nr:hypothetical protein NIASO_19600 [Niabella soli DSM 19437]
MWLGVGIIMFTIVAAAMRVQDDSVCAGYDINIKGAGGGGSLFTSEAQIIKLLKEAAHGDIKGERKSGFNLPGIEDLLEQSSWVYNAELYFDNKDILRVNVTERRPLARVFTAGGQSFYIDEAGKQIPLSDKVSLDVPVFTGYPNNKIMKASDSSLLENMIAAASFINNDSFWVAQVSQIDIHPDGKDRWDMQMIPVVGNHRVDLGDGSEIASKFHRLYLFYDQVLKRTGFDKYKTVEVQYNGQVVGVKGTYTKLDSIQLRKNIEQLLQQSRKANDLIEVAPAVAGVKRIEVDTAAEAKLVYGQPLNDDGLDTLDLMPVGDKSQVSASEAVAAPPVVVPAGQPLKNAEEGKEVVKKTAPKRSEEKEPVHKKTAPAKKAVKQAPARVTNTKEAHKKPAEKKVVAKSAHTTAKKPAVKPNATRKEHSAKPATGKGTSNKKDVKKPVAKPAADKKKTTKKNTD